MSSWFSFLTQRKEKGVALPTIPRRPRNLSVEDYGRCLVLGGNQFAACTAYAALRLGVANVEVAVPPNYKNAVESYRLSYKCSDVHTAFSKLSTKQVVVLGDNLNPFITNAVYKNFSGTIVVHPSSFLHLLRSKAWEHPKSQQIVVVFDRKSADAFTNKTMQFGSAIQYSDATSCVGISPGFPAMVALQKEFRQIDTGNSSLHALGAESIQCGIIAGLMAGSLLSPFDAAWLGTHIYGRAADIAAMWFGELSVTLEDVLESIPHAVVECPVS